MSPSTRKEAKARQAEDDQPNSNQVDIPDNKSLSVALSSVLKISIHNAPPKTRWWVYEKRPTPVGSGNHHATPHRQNYENDTGHVTTFWCVRRQSGESKRPTTVGSHFVQALGFRAEF
jgi:hypothetical protein